MIRNWFSRDSLVENQAAKIRILYAPKSKKKTEVNT